MVFFDGERFPDLLFDGEEPDLLVFLEDPFDLFWGLREYELREPEVVFDSGMIESATLYNIREMPIVTDPSDTR